MKKIAVLTSGGDAPGMNAAIRAVTRKGIENGLEVFGVLGGYRGLVDGEFRHLQRRDVGGIIQAGGTFLSSARCEEFRTEAGQRKALRNLNQHGIEGLVVIGGNGSQTGANALHKLGFPVVGAASTIDNDLYGSDITIGVDTALNIALEAIDRLKITATSHERAFLIEVMGRDSGYLAMMAGMAGGAEAICVPEIETTPEQVEQTLLGAYQRGKTHAIVVVAEGAKYDADALSNYFREHTKHVGFDLRTTRLGHVQRGGLPLISDRILGTRLGAAAVDELHAGNHGVLVGVRGGFGGEIITTPLADIAGKNRPLDPAMMELAEALAK
ncbi:MAG: 6-phosphofructokinase [Anaerolineaceae bacterium]|nr:MAG: 6-phosphofructokinase [Anaerolineaceae bacterium]